MGRSVVADGEEGATKASARSVGVASVLRLRSALVKLHVV